MAKKNGQRRDATTVIREFSDGHEPIIEEFTNEEFDKILDIIEDARSMSSNKTANKIIDAYETIDNKHKNAVDPVIEYRKGSYPDYDGETVRTLVDKALMFTGDTTQPFIPANVIVDNNRGRIIAEVPDANGKAWYGSLDRPCIIGSYEGAYGVFIPWSCNSRDMRVIGSALIDESTRINRERMELPFIDSYYYKTKELE